jgi:2-aminoethylphosphonate-pyruvate transaminase
MFDNLKTEDKLLFTPGPLSTTKRVKEAGLHDLGSREEEFITHVHEIRHKLLELAHVKSPEYESVIIQGSGTFGIESVISSAIPDTGMLLNIINGSYGRRISQIARIHSIPLVELIYAENQLPVINEIESVLEENSLITHMSVIHGETTTGLVNPIAEIGKVAAVYNTSFIVDAMSTFGAYDIDLKSLNISYLISSSNKCIEGIPGFSFIRAKRSELEKCKDQARSLSLDLYDQWAGLNSNGQFRFTPPVQAILSFHQALTELEREGGIKARSLRYRENNRLLVNEMGKLGFNLYLPDEISGFVITSFLYPSNKKFVFNDFYSKLNSRGFVIYPGKLSKVDCFRIGNIGQLYATDIINLIVAVKDVLKEMSIIPNTSY